MQARLERLERRDVIAAEDAAGIGALDDVRQPIHVVHELRQDRGGERGIGKAAPAREVGFGKALGHVKAAVAGEAFEKDAGESLRLAAAPGADVAHEATSSPVAPSSSRAR